MSAEPSSDSKPDLDAPPAVAELPLQQAVQELHDALEFRALLAEWEQAERELYRLPARLQVLHERAVQYPPALAHQVSHLMRKIKTEAAQARQRARYLREQHMPEASALVRELRAGVPLDANAFAALCERAATLSEQVAVADQTVVGSLLAVQAQLTRIENRLQALEWAAVAFADATFALDSGELLLAAHAARYRNDDGALLEGVCFLTTQRLLFEQREKVQVRQGLLAWRRPQNVQRVVFDTSLARLAQLGVGRRVGSPFDRPTLNLKVRGEAEPTIRTISFDLQGAEDQWLDQLEAVRAAGVADQV